MKIVNIWLDNPLNDATAYYVDLLEKAFVTAGLKVARVYSHKEAIEADLVLTLHAKATCQILLHRPKAKVITWFQGIVPEEAMLWKGKRLPNRVYKLAWELFEVIALRMSSLCIFVSDAMHDHYLRKYRLSPKSYQVIPCFNKSLNTTAFYYEDKFTKPNFVYAGGLDRWQCIDEMLTMFASIQKRIPEASLTILSGQQEVAAKLLTQYGIQGGRVSYVPLAQIDQELQKYKYGFMLRADHPINNVATPTKMNTYLSCGIIPIYTSAVRDFEKKLAKLPYSIKAERPDDEEIVRRVIENEGVEIVVNKILESYEEIFDSYYSEKRYVTEVAGKIRQLEKN